ncbi:MULTISPECIES: hydrogenase maturation nickel metallochaperone HypA [Bradyrhizobium]|uniref:Hydrogenase maturation factor HypA n=1 Tax=Bradyrhizobium yuanmingense TaxID=108015 RepID=A0A1C3XFN1_9BRAD|nr:MULTISPECIES: hydrogenase maturation nickel metallochaperone HypA [Bradyrhizobium]MCA1543517.1 hydrogenase maturation nickel metallochaperone HypA [Bradyrhizobium sp. NBAIM32]MDA9545166.1 hydrogenase nickel incorporation protein HypA [Bradyrhizobium sp. CCBAU 45321]RQH04536.1 hydrogenase maturation nickel metallochaperone HypA [Bradyrhizobium sp. RP6]TWI19262.1 hydrogenase-3 nickel incorporation protein HypA [Bradyrhizobium yuanmingense]UWU93474.1 hydrogenase maturation nickel metallochaper
MHEMAICLGIIQIVEEKVHERSSSRVRSICLEMGALSHAAPEAIRFCFAAAATRTVAEGAALNIVELPGVAWCMSCSKSVEIARRGECCPCCGSYHLQVTAGEQMRVKELEID